MASLHATQEAIQRHNEMVRAIDSTLQQTLALVHDAIKGLAAIDDPAARTAESLAKKGHDDICNVVYGWLNDYVRRSSELTHRIEV